MNWTLIWAVWAITAAVSGGVLETIALIDRRKGDTLSEKTRALLGIEPVKPIRRVAIPVFVAVFVGFVAWFVPHIVLQWGWWDPWR